MNKRNEIADAEQVAAYAATMYRAVRVLPDGSVAALVDLFTTRAIVLGVSMDGWERRFCFADLALAVQRFEELTSEDDQPEGWIARRPKQPGD